MTLHLPTLMLALLLGFLLLTLEFGISQCSTRSRPELRRWTWGSWAFLAGLLALLARQVVPMELSIVLGNALLCLGMVAYVQALYLHLLSAPAPRWLMRSQPALWLGLIVMLYWPLQRRTAVLSPVYALLLAPAVWVILRHGWRSERSLYEAKHAGRNRVEVYGISTGASAMLLLD